MENIAEKLNLVIDYIEDHLTEDLDQTQIAKIACCSYYDVARMFSLIADISISDYVRRRRLTLAGLELKHTGAKVIDVAVKYGYDSAVSFARAFLAFHGFNPSLACREDSVLRMCPRLIFQINIKGVREMIRKDFVTVQGKEYEALYFGEEDMSLWSDRFVKRKFWRLENAYDDFKDKTLSPQVLPYNNYPPIQIETGQIFLIEYKTTDGKTHRRYYIADGTVWNGMVCTREFWLESLEPERMDRITAFGKEYEALYFGEEDMSLWSDRFVKRRFWRLENAHDDFKDKPLGSQVLPYNNYPRIRIEIGQIFLIEYEKADGKTHRRYYIADGTVWNDLLSTRQFDLKS